MGLKVGRFSAGIEPKLKSCRVGHRYKWLNGARVCECDMSASDLYVPEDAKR